MSGPVKIMSDRRTLRVDKTTTSWVRLFQIAHRRNPTITEFKNEKFDDIPSDPDMEVVRGKVLKELAIKDQ